MNKLKLLFYIYWDILSRKYWLWKSKKSVINGLVLMYHHITDEKLNVSQSCVHKISQFKETLMRLKNEGYLFVTIDNALQIIESHSSQMFAVVTFDDVPEDVFINAYPILKELRIPFTLFITIDYIGKEGYLNQAHIKEMCSDSLCTIGSHTLTHPMLRNSSHIQREIFNSKKQIEDMIGREVKYIAYPYGKRAAVSYESRRLAQKAGYKCAFGTIDAPISDYTSTHTYYLPRMVLYR